MEPSKEERREVEEMEEVDLEEGRAGGEIGNGERISSMVCDAKTSLVQIYPSLDLGHCRPLYLPPNGWPSILVC